MLVAYQNDISRISFRDLERVGIDNLRALDAERIMRNPAELKVHQFHREASNRRIKLFRAVESVRELHSRCHSERSEESRSESFSRQCEILGRLRLLGMTRKPSSQTDAVAAARRATNQNIIN
jgi:hypothetical protein